jgi:hypothetical protein
MTYFIVYITGFLVISIWSSLDALRNTNTLRVRDVLPSAAFGSWAWLIAGLVATLAEYLDHGPIRRFLDRYIIVRW